MTIKRVEIVKINILCLFTWLLYLVCLTRIVRDCSNAFCLFIKNGVQNIKNIQLFSYKTDGKLVLFGWMQEFCK